VVALIAPSTLNYLITMFALSRLGYTVLILSIRLQVPAYVSLLEKTDCWTILTTEQFSATIAGIQRERPVKSLPLLRSEDYLHVDAPDFPTTFTGPEQSSKIAWIIHSSGSTGLPKPIFQTHRSCLANYEKGFPLRAFITLPLYHNHGVCCTFRSLYLRKTIYLFNGNLPFTGENLVSVLRYVQPELVSCVPYILKLLGELPDGVEELKKPKIVLFGGSACPDEIGNHLTAQGVNLVGHYGT
jgi:acyl-CoA synthetase (AMP-forming)/AMP-acid ligase II